MTRVLVCGSRHWGDRDCIASALVALVDAFGPESHVLHGNAPGADKIAAEVAAEVAADALCLVTTAFPARWRDHGKAAGPIHNEVMLARGKPDLVIAFHRDVESSRGTRHMLGIARSAGVPTYVIGGLDDVAGFRDELSRARSGRQAEE